MSDGRNEVGKAYSPVSVSPIATAEIAMGISSSELPRTFFTSHEQYVLRYAEKGAKIPADPETIDILTEDKLILSTEIVGVYRLTELGELACTLMRNQIDEIVVNPPPPRTNQ